MCQLCSNPSCWAGNICQNLNSNGLNCNGAFYGTCGPIPNWLNQAYNPAWPNGNGQCGCNPLVGSNCVWFQGATTPCLGIKTNTNITQAIQIIDAAICAISPSGISPSPSGCPTVTGTTNQIVINQSGSGCASNYQIGVSNVILNNISTLQSQVQSISTFLNSTIATLVTNTPQYISVYNSGANTWTINYTQNPSGQSGIIYSDYTNSTTSNTSWTTVKTYPLAPNQLNTNGDKVVVRTEYVNTSPSSNLAYVRIQFNGITLVQQFPWTPKNMNVLDFEVWIVRTSNASADIKLKYTGGVDNGTYYQTFGTTGISYLTTISGLNLGTTSYPIDVDIMSVSPGDIVCRYLEIEYIHFI